MIKRKQFERTTLDENYDKADIISVRLNREDRAMLEGAKQDLELEGDSTALKALLKIQYGYVIHTHKIVEETVRRMLSQSSREN